LKHSNLFTSAKEVSYVIAFVCVSVCVFVYQQDNTKSSMKKLSTNFDQIFSRGGICY